MVGMQRRPGIVVRRRNPVRPGSPVRLLLRVCGHLILLQAVLGVPVFLFFDRTWLARALAVGYLLLVSCLGVMLGWEARTWPTPRALAGAAVVAVLWQGPALVGTGMAARLYWGFDAYTSANDLTDFAMQMWHTALLPLFAALPQGFWQGAAYYYWATVLAAPVLLLLFLFMVAVGRRGEW